MRNNILLLMLLVCGAGPVQAREFSAFLDAEVLGGQFFFQDAASSFGGIASLTFGPAWKVSDRSTLFGSYNGSYKGFKDVHDLVGGGQLFQESMDHRLSLKWARQLSETWALKPRFSYTKEFFRETKDEQWGKGLYDYDRMGGGLAAERNGMLLDRPSRLSFGYNLFWTKYPNYQSLASLFGQELASSGPGSRTLDTLSHDLSFEGSLGLSEKWDSWLSYTLSLRDFTDQRVVNQSGSYESFNRSDLANQVNLGFGFKPERRVFGLQPSLSLSYRLDFFHSNQNHFDTSQNQFLPNYYDYLEHGINLSGELGSQAGTKASLGYSYSTRGYQDRLAQNTNGLYLGDKLSQETHLISFTLGYPLYRELLAKASGQWKQVLANTAFEKTYRYTFSAMNYFAGLGYSF